MAALFVPVSGFLGAGKTTTLLAAARELRERGRVPAVVTNDQGRDLVDTQLARTAVDRVGEVVDGCFCCRFEELASVVTELVAGGADVVLAEAVGSCTDLRATVVRPLRAATTAVRVAPLTTVVDPLRYRRFARSESDAAYLYAHQIAEADVLAVNKIDLIGRELGPMLADLKRRNPAARVVPYSARSGQVAALVDLLTEAEPADRPDEELDYDRYAAAEAELAWLNHEVTVRGTFAPGSWVVAALSALSAACTDVLVGHAKVTVSNGSGLAKASLTAGGETPTLDLAGPSSVTGATAVFNLRVACSPTELDRACTTAIAAADVAIGTTSTASAEPAAFLPAYPRPSHRVSYT